MSDLEKLKQALSDVRGHLQDLQVEQQATTHDIKALAGLVKNLETRSVHQEASMSALGGTFASIEQILTSLLADRELVERLERQNQALAHSVTDLARRVEALEKRAS